MSARLLDSVRDAFVGDTEVPQSVATGSSLAQMIDVTVDRKGHSVLDAVSLEVMAGEAVAVIGPNGAGKSTLLAALSGDLPVAQGEVFIAGIRLADWTPRALARRRAVLLQNPKVGFPFTSLEVVTMGRTPWLHTAEAANDYAAVRDAIAATDIGHLKARSILNLSGGEMARVAMARVLAQQTQLLLLDEPTAALDIHHEHMVLSAIRRKVEHGASAIVVLHDLALAAEYADRIVLVSGGRIEADGPPEQVLTSERLSLIYGHPVEVHPHPVTGAPLVLASRPNQTNSILR